jgi:hypothetical protein
MRAVGYAPNNHHRGFNCLRQPVCFKVGRERAGRRLWGGLLELRPGPAGAVSLIGTSKAFARHCRARIGSVLNPREAECGAEEKLGRVGSPALRLFPILSASACRTARLFFDCRYSFKVRPIIASCCSSLTANPSETLSHFDV